MLIGRPLATADSPHQTIGKDHWPGGFFLRCDVIHSLCHTGNVVILAAAGTMLLDLSSDCHWHCILLTIVTIVL